MYLTSHHLICKMCKFQRDKLGTKLPRASLLIINREKGIPLFRDYKLSVNEEDGLDMLDFIKYADLVLGVKADLDRYGSFWLAGYIPKIEKKDLENEEFVKHAKKELEIEDKEKLLAEPKTLEMISFSSLEKNNQEVIGRKLLCVLKADVDNLGLVFSIGLQNRLSISRYASLSRMLNVFFAGYLVEKIKNITKYRDIYVVFAGGDDLFLIGPWHQTIDFAIEIRKDFSEFCANNRDMGLSCGLYVMKPKYPVRRAARWAEELLENAKSRKKNNLIIKDGVCIFDEVMSWEELIEQIKFGTWLKEKALDNASRINRAFLYRMLNYLKAAKKFEQDPSTNWKEGLFYTHLLYDISRNIITTNNKGEIINKEEIDYILEKVNLIKENKNISKNVVGIQYALCSIRK